MSLQKNYRCTPLQKPRLPSNHPRLDVAHPSRAPVDAAAAPKPPFQTLRLRFTPSRAHPVVLAACRPPAEKTPPTTMMNAARPGTSRVRHPPPPSPLLRARLRLSVVCIICATSRVVACRGSGGVSRERSRTSQSTAPRFVVWKRSAAHPCCVVWCAQLT